MNIQYDKTKITSTLKETSLDDSDKSNKVYLVNDTHTAEKRIMDRYRINGYSRRYMIECVAIEAAKYLLG